MSASVMRKATLKLLTRFEGNVSPLVCGATYKTSQARNTHGQNTSLGIGFTQDAKKVDNARILITGRAKYHHNHCRHHHRLFHHDHHRHWTH